MPDPYKLVLRNPEIEAKLTEIGRMMRDSLPPGWGFLHMIFEYGEGEGLFYISSAKREDVIKMMQEFIDKFREN